MNIMLALMLVTMTEHRRESASACRRRQLRRYLLRRRRQHTSIGEALRALRLNRLRTGLTMFGMSIGVAAVVLMLAVGQGAPTTVNQKSVVCP